jgi:tRNA dimethylallyltransferase
MRKFIFVVGPTASGKSDWALEQAKKNNGVIFNCDSVQLYQEVNIGSAKPSDEERARVPHHLIDVVAPPNEITSGDYRDLFLEELKKIPEATPVYVVGGTGFYFLALEKGLYEIEEASAELKAEIEEQAKTPTGIEKFLEEIRAQDPTHAEKLHLNDHYRITRAVEILRSNPNQTITQIAEAKKQAKGLDGEIQKVGIRWSAADLESRIRQRTQKMLRAGLIEETQSLLERGLENWSPLKSVGYKEVVQFLKGQIPREQLEEQIVVATRQLAKKQRTWFQRDQQIQWIEMKP